MTVALAVHHQPLPEWPLFIISPIWFLKVENLKVPPRLINHKTCFLSFKLLFFKGEKLFNGCVSDPVVQQLAQVGWVHGAAQVLRSLCDDFGDIFHHY